MPRRLSGYGLGLCLALLITTGTATTAHSQQASVALHPGWQMQVLATDLPQVDNLATGPQGGLFATLEIGSRIGRSVGRIVRITPSGTQLVMDKLNRPDGLLIHGKHLFVVEEANNGRLIMVGLSSGKTVLLGRFNKPEGLAMLADGSLVLSEDSKQGRLLQVTMDGTTTVLMEGLNRPEGIARAEDGTIYVAETGTGRILAYRDGATRVVQDGIAEPDQIIIGPSGALWVTEDRPNGRLLKIDAGGVTVIATHLYSPQGILFKGGQLLLAEQGRSRILALTPPRQTD